MIYDNFEWNWMISYIFTLNTLIYAYKLCLSTNFEGNKGRILTAFERYDLIHPKQMFIIILNSYYILLHIQEKRAAGSLPLSMQLSEKRYYLQVSKQQQQECAESSTLKSWKSQHVAELTRNTSIRFHLQVQKKWLINWNLLLKRMTKT